MKRRQIQLLLSGTGRYVPAEIVEMVCDEELAGRPRAPLERLPVAAARHRLLRSREVIVIKRRRPKISRPPYPGEYAWGGIHEAISEEEKAGRPRAPLVELLSPRAPDDREPPAAELPKASPPTE